MLSPKAKQDYATDELRWADLMVRSQQGDKPAYQQLLAELSTVIQRYLISRLGSHDFIEDCTQEVLLAIHHARHTYEVNRPFRPWMFAIVRNKSIDMLRKRKSHEKIVNSQMEAAQIAASHGDHNHFSQAMDSDIIHGRLINALAPPFRQAIVLTKLIGFSNAEAAKKLSISETALKVRVHRGIAKLKNLLEADEV